MWFKNIFVFAFNREFTHNAQELETLLKESIFTPCASTEMQHYGWTPSLGKHSQALVHEVDGNMLVCARREEKILPAAVIKEMVETKIDELEHEQARAATKKEKEQIKEDVIFELLPRAFSRTIDTHAYINSEKNIIVVHASSRSKAEDLLALLRKCLGTLPVTSISPEIAPDELMTDWLVEQPVTEPFRVGTEAQLDSIGDHGSQVQVKQTDLASSEVKAHLDADMFVTKLSLEFDEMISCVLHDDLSIKKIKFYDVLHEQNDDIDKEDVLARLDADLAIMCGELNRLVIELLNKFSLSPSDYLEA